MRFARTGPFLMLVLWASVAGAQSTGAATAGQDDAPRLINVEGAAGALLNAGGFNVSGSIGYLLTRRISAHLAADMVHLPTEVNVYDGGYGVRRGATMRLLSGEVRLAFAPSHRVSPYALAGMGFGISRPNVNQYFRGGGVTNNMRLAFTGIGVRFQVNPHLSVVADTRFALERERDVVGLLLPLRGGVSWSF